MLTIVGWLWRDEKCMTRYTVEDANVWARMLHRHITIPHRFVLVTDYVVPSPESRVGAKNLSPVHPSPLTPHSSPTFDPLIEPIPLWKDHHLLTAPNWRREFPQCYVRLKAFSAEMAPIFGPRFVSIDLDCVAIANLDAILSRSEDFLIYRRPIVISEDRLNPYQASMWMMDTGSRSQVWRDFKGDRSLRQIADYEMSRFWLNTDQGWMLYKLGPNEKGWTIDDGVYSWKWLEHKQKRPPDNAALIFFHGKLKPKDYFWITENYK